MTVLIIALFVLLLLGIAFLVIRRLRRTRTQRRPRARDLVPAHLQDRRVDNALIRHLVRRERVQGVSPAGVAVRRLMKKSGRSR